MNEIYYVKTDDGEALYLNGFLYDTNNELNIYDLLVMLETKGIVDKARAIRIESEPIVKRGYDFPVNFKKLKIK